MKPLPIWAAVFFCTNTEQMKRIKLLYEIIKSRKSLLLVAMGLLLTSIFLRTLEPKIIQVVIDSYLKNDDLGTGFFVNVFQRIANFFSEFSTFERIVLLCGTYVLMAGLRSIIILGSRSITYSVSEKAMQEFRVNLFEHIQKMPLSAFSKLNKGELIQRSTGDIDTIKNFISNHTVELIRLLALFSFSAIMLFQINVTYALWCISLCPIIFISTYIFFIYEGKVWKIHEDEADKLTNIAQENLNGIRTVKAYNRMSEEIEKFGKQNQRKFEAGMKNIKLHTFFWPFSDMFLYMQVVIFIILGGLYVIDGRMTLGGLVAAYTYNTMLGFPLRQAGRVLSQMSMALVAIDRIQDILTIKRESNAGEEATSLTGDIQFQNVDFSYSDEDKSVLNDVSFELKQGEKLAIMGGSASGKTSLMKLLTRLYEPKSGTIFIDSKPIRDYSLSSLRNKIGFVMQQSILFSMNLGENLSYANEESDNSNKKNMLHQAGFENYETILPQGMDTQIGEHGVSLSGGQKQRLSLARALMKENDILILDDITSALDKQTERRVLDNVLNSNSDISMFIITHRISTLTKVDKVLVLDKNGSIQSFGNPEELIKKDKFLIELEQIEEDNIDLAIKENS